MFGRCAEAKEPPRSVAVERPVITGWACTCKYRYIALIQTQCPTMQMRLLSTQAHNRAIAPPARADRMETSAAV